MHVYECPHCERLLGVTQNRKMSTSKNESFIVKLPYQCEQCGTDFIPEKARNRAQRFCSAKCRVKAGNDKRLAKERRDIRRGRDGPLLRSRTHGLKNFSGPILLPPKS